MTETELGLRERKRLSTKRSIQRAVLTLAADRGFDNVTVEEVSRKADIAPRTFFNYFPTKEAALIADLPHQMDETAVAQFVAGQPHGELWSDFGELVAGELGGFDGDRELVQLRHCVFRDSPHLSKLHFTNLREMEDRFTDVIRQRLDAHVPAGAKPATDEEISVIRGIASGVLRSAWITWAQSEDETSLSDRIRAAFDQVTTVVSNFR